MDKIKFGVIRENHFPKKITEFNKTFDIGPVYAKPWINTTSCVIVNF